jgi:signal transduction histidine kinase
VQTAQLSPELADAADVLGDRHLDELRRFAALLEPHRERIGHNFEQRLRSLALDAKQRKALNAITYGAAAQILAQGHAPLRFIEQVEYNGRRLAKLNLPPTAILKALKEYDRALEEALESDSGGKQESFEWVREQLHSSVILTLNNAFYQVREAETEAFYQQFRIELEARSLDELLQRFLETLIDVCRADTGCLYMLNPEATVWLAKGGHPAKKRMVRNAPLMQQDLSRPQCARIGKDESGPCLPPDDSWRKRFSSCWSVPLVSGGRTEGVMQFAFLKEYEWLPREQELLAAAAERCVIAAQKQRLMEDLAQREEQVRRLAEHMLHVEEVERRRISRELHDEAGQSWLCIRLQMEMLEERLPSRQGRWRNQLRETRDLTERTILEMRRLIAALSPAVLEQLGLGAALRQLVTRFQRLHPCRVRLQLNRLRTLPQQTETIAYRLVQECFNNIGKHSGASAATIALSSSSDSLQLRVQDNGAGFRVEEALQRRDSFGLSGMRERVALLNGNFWIESRMQGPKRGTKICIELPISKSEPASGQRRAVASYTRATPALRRTTVDSTSKAKELGRSN